jgi:hypothetical protein
MPQEEALNSIKHINLTRISFIMFSGWVIAPAGYANR